MHRKCLYYLTVISIVLISILYFYTPSYAGIIYTGDYEGGNFAGWTDREYCCGYSQQISSSPVRAGKYASRYELRYTDPIVNGGKRSEVVYKNANVGKLGGDEWYGFSTNLPADYKVDSAYDLVGAQWHDIPDGGGEVWRSPVLAWYTITGKWQIWTRYSSKPIQTSNDGTMVLLWEAPYQTGVWTDWVLHVKWDYRPDGNGFVEVWKDGKQIVNYKGPNAYNDQNNFYLKMGVYKWDWNNNQPTDVTTRVVYIDELRIGDSNSSYAEVAPRLPDTTPPSAPILALQP